MRALTLQQFRGACAVVDAGFNVSRAATARHTTQSSVSKTIKGLEDELGAPIFLRTSARIVGLTDYGQELIERARGILRDMELVVSRAQQDRNDVRGVLKIGTTHLHARYSLPTAIQIFRAKYPLVSIELEQGHANDIATWVSSRRVHLGLANIGARNGLVTFPVMTQNRCIVVPRGHELLSFEKPALADVARFPIVCYNEHHPEGVKLRALFKQLGLEPAIVVSATDASVQKEYVAAGLGVAILHRIAIEQSDYEKLAVIDASHLLPPTETKLLIRQGEHLRAYVYAFIEAFRPHWTQRAVIEEIQRQTTTDSAWRPTWRGGETHNLERGVTST